MTPEVLGALRRMLDELDADAGVVVRLAPSGSGVVASSTLPPVRIGDAWGPPGALGGEDGRPELVVEADRLAVIVPTAARLAMPDPVTAALVVPLAETMSCIVLLWATSMVPPDVLGKLESGAFRRFVLLAPLLDAQIQVQEAATRLWAVVAALGQAVVVTATGGGTATVNVAAGQLLGLRPGTVDATDLSDALDDLRGRATDPSALAVEAHRLLASPTAVVRDWVWALHGSPSHLRVTSVPVDTLTGTGRVWVFDDISTEMELLESERRHHRALALSELRYRTVAENISDVVVQGTPEGIITWVSPSVTAATGWLPADLVGRRFPDLVHPEDLSTLMEHMERLERGEPISLDVRIRTSSGDHRWMSIRVKPVLDDDGRIVGRVAGWWHAQAAHEAMEQLERSERRYRLLLENTSEVVFQTVDGILTWISPAVEEVTGWPPEAVVGGGTGRFWHPDDWEKARGLRDGAHQGAHGREVLRLRRPDGQYMWVEVVVRPYVEAYGRPGAVGMMYDVSERVMAQEAARASGERYRTVAENASDVVCRYRPDGVIDWAFGSTQALAGRTAEELVGTAALSLLVPADLGDRDVIDGQIARGEVVRRLARLVRPDGSTRWVELRTKAVPTTGTSTGYLIGTWRDAQAEVEYRDALAASERQARDLADAYEAARDEAMEASAAKTAFLSRTSHELRTPLNAVLGFAQLLALDPLSDEQMEAVSHIRRGGRHLLDLINEVLDISRIEAGRLSLSMETVDAQAVVTDAVELVQPLAREHAVSLVVEDCRVSPPFVEADQQRIRQVLLNLLSNAVKYNRRGGSVDVGCRPLPGGEVAIDVTDTGPGLADEMLPRLFQPFDRLGAEGGAVEGTGLGLALAHGLAAAMGGRIEVVTEVGAGSTFTVVLRAAAAGESVPETPERETGLRGDGSLRILYIEDNPTNATLMARVVALRPGCVLLVAPDGAQGLAAARREAPDLVLLDLHLPDMHGEEVLRELRKVPACADVPVVVVTADASPGARERMLGLGSNGFLTKPIDLDDVLAWIDSVLTSGQRP
jgi:PAS domain S-box-containing protein